MGSSSNLNSTFGQDWIRAAQDNPIPAALIGMGVLWWFSGGSQTTIGGQSMSGAGPSFSRLGEQTFGAGRSALDATGGAASMAGDQIAEASSRLATGASEAVNSAANLAQRHGIAMQRDLADLLERRPLALGAIGLCLGAVVASAFPATEAEKEMFGEASDAIKDQVATLVSEGVGTAGDAKQDAGGSKGVDAGKATLRKTAAVVNKALDAAANKISK